MALKITSTRMHSVDLILRRWRHFNFHWTKKYSIMRILFLPSAQVCIIVSAVLIELSFFFFKLFYFNILYIENWYNSRFQSQFDLIKQSLYCRCLRFKCNSILVTLNIIVQNLIATFCTWTYLGQTVLK